MVELEERREKKVDPEYRPKGHANNINYHLCYALLRYLNMGKIFWRIDSAIAANAIADCFLKSVRQGYSLWRQSNPAKKGSPLVEGRERLRD